MNLDLGRVKVRLQSLIVIDELRGGCKDDFRVMHLKNQLIADLRHAGSVSMNVVTEGSGQTVQSLKQLTCELCIDSRFLGELCRGNI